MICPHCFKETNDKWIKDGAGTCEHCHRIIHVELTQRELNSEITLPGSGKMISEFAEEVAKEIKDKNTLFYRVDSKEIIEIGKIKHLETEEEAYTGFLSIKAQRFITLLEKYISPGAYQKNKRTEEIEFKRHSISSELSGTLLASDQLQKQLSQIRRIFTIPIPILYKGEITFPCQGYDKRFGSWLPEDAPTITEPEMNLEEAKQVFKDIFCETGGSINVDSTGYCETMKIIKTKFINRWFDDC